MTALLSANFPKRDIHLVIDDASHFYEETRNALDLVFPYMAAGSAYVIEDWGWAHWASRVWTNPYFDNKLPLTNLIFELVSLCATEPEIVSSVDISPSMTVVHRGKKSVRDGWSIRDCCSWREGILQQIP